MDTKNEYIRGNRTQTKIRIIALSAPLAQFEYIYLWG